MSVHPNGGMPARGAVVRWSWRLFRRDWRQHLLIVVLLTVSVAAAVGFTCAAYNVAPTAGDAEFGDATHFFRFENDGPAALEAKLDAGAEWFGSVDAIGHRPVPVPGTDQTVDYRSQDPDGPFGAPMLSLVGGRYPTVGSEAAVTAAVAELVGTDVGSTIDLDGFDRTVVGIVENPSDLDDDFVLLAPSELAASESVAMLVEADDERVHSFHPPDANGRTVSGGRSDVREDVMAAVLVLVVATLALFLVALIATASFTVIAQRRLPQLGMMSAVGATEKHLRLTMLASGTATGAVAAATGAVVGVAGWILIAPRMESAAGYRINPFDVPWILVAATIVLAVIASTAAAWWPGRTVSRIPTVLALSGRPPRPAPLHRSTLLGFGLLVVGVVCLVIGGRATDGLSSAELLSVCLGILGVAGGVLLASPLAISALASLAGGAPIAERLALRDLGRFRARSAAALAAVALALGLPVVIVATTAAAENQLGPGNLPANQILVQQAQVNGPFLPHPESVAGMQDGVDAIADALDDAAVIRLDGAVNPNARPDPNVDAVPGISVARKHGDEGWADLGLIYLATPDLLDQYGLDPDAADDAGILTSFALPLDVIDLGDAPPPRSADGQREASRPFEPLEEPGDLPDTYSAWPGALVSSAEMASRGWVAEPSGRWLIVNTSPLTPDQVDDARAIAVQYGLSIEARDESSTLADVRTGAVAVGMVLALGILAMTVGLIRAESIGELRTLTAAGATGSIRRRITAVTAGGLAALGALLGTAGAYLALVAAQIDDLAPVPVVDLAIIVIGTPIAAAAVGWFFAGREPEVLGRRPID